LALRRIAALSGVVQRLWCDVRLKLYVTRPWSVKHSETTRKPRSSLTFQNVRAKIFIADNGEVIDTEIMSTLENSRHEVVGQGTQ
jgi:hypothetical protein